ncbi:MAG TPA: hypothetical protein VII10_07700 [Reyranella sp.]|jgi:hypothetical protein
MALDVYVGSLARYYAGEWENIAEKTARERGTQYQIGRPGGSADRLKDPERIPSAVVAWRSNLSESLGSKIMLPLDWEENLEAPYFTGRPGWDGFGSLVLWTAYAEHPALRQPATLPEEWDNDPALMRSNVAGFRSRYSHLVRNVELWLPSPFEFTFEGEDIDGRRVVVGSTTTLRRQLEGLNAATWKAEADAVAEWSRQPLLDDAPLELCARYAFAVLLDLARQAVEHKLPMKLDY